MGKKAAQSTPEPQEDEEDEEMAAEDFFKGDFTFPDLSEYTGEYLKTTVPVGKVAVVRDESEEAKAGFSVEMGKKFLVVTELDASRTDLAPMRNGDIVRLVNDQKVTTLDEYKTATDDAKEFTVKLYREKVSLHGQGVLRAGPETFEGSFIRGSYEAGTFVGIDGSKYSGGFRNGQFHGPGEYSWTDGRVYKGMWQDGKMHGRGRFENFSFGVDRIFEGFCAFGLFQSGDQGQEDAKKSFLADYGTGLVDSASAALREMAARVKTPDDGKGKKGGTADEAPAEIGKEFLVPCPSSGELDEAEIAEKALIDELAMGPFPEAATLPTAAALQAFAALFTPSADMQPPTGEVTLFEEMGLKGRFDGARLKKQQLAYGGQAVEFFAPEAESGSVSLMVLMNISNAYDVAQARWKLIHTEDVPRPNSAPDAEEDKKKGKR